VTPMCPSLSVPIRQEQRGFLYRYFSFSTVSVKTLVGLGQYCWSWRVRKRANYRSVQIVRIAKPLLLVATPIGLLDGFYECYKLAGGLLFLMVAMVGVLGVGMATVIATIRREARASRDVKDVSLNTKEGECRP
jgi:hypothetical protein